MTAVSSNAAQRGAEWAGVLAVAAVAVVLVLQPRHDDPLGLAAAPLLLVLSWIVVVDLRHWIIPDAAVVAVAVLGAGWRVSVAEAAGAAVPLEIFLIALDAAVWGGALFLMREVYFRRRGFDGLGLGDVKLACACAILNGIEGFAWALLLASLGGLLIAGGAALHGKRIGKVPFGAFLAPASGLLWLAGWTG